MTDIPREIQIGPYPHKVLCDYESIAKMRLDEGGSGIYGRYWWYALEIHIDPGIPRAHQREALFHEVRHGVWHVLKMDEGKELSEEECINRETPLLLDTLRRNPDLVRFLTEPD